MEAVNVYSWVACKCPTQQEKNEKQKQYQTLQFKLKLFYLTPSSTSVSFSPPSAQGFPPTGDWNFDFGALWEQWCFWQAFFKFYLVLVFLTNTK